MSAPTVSTVGGDFTPAPVTPATIVAVCELLGVPADGAVAIRLTPKMVEVDVVTDHRHPPMTVRMRVEREGS